MRIRKYLITVIAILLILVLGGLATYQYFFAGLVGQKTNAMETQTGIYRRARVEQKKIQIYAGGRWADFDLRGVQLSSFYPGYDRNQSNIKKEEVLGWLEIIADLGFNTIQVPYLQPPNFYSALYDFNLGRNEPLYILHSIPIDAETAMVFYNAYQPEIVDNMWADMRHTVDALHGKAVVLDNDRHHRGLYLKDVSAYVLGYLVGDNTSAEVITLTNRRFPQITNYLGDNYATENSTAFECFIAENLDYLCRYELSRYGSLSLYSYLASPETDPLSHRNESNVTRNADIDLENIRQLRGDMHNLVACYTAHPNSPDFMDYESVNDPTALSPNQPSAYQLYLHRLVDHHSTPVLLTGVGIPASRGVSRVDLDDGYDRGGHSEQEQGRLLVRLLEDARTAGCGGVVIQSFQDDWSLHSSNNVRDFGDEDTTPYWQDIQASDECFGLYEFVPGRQQRLCTVDGDPSEWRDIAPLYDSGGMQMSVQSDSTFLYLLVRISDFRLRKDKLFIALDVTPESGATYWDEEALELPFPTDFILHFNGYNESRIMVQNRYNLFEYRYMYYSYIMDKKAEMPKKDEPSFGGVYQMNRYNILLKELNKLAPVLYRQTGTLVHGTANPDDPEYNSLTDFAAEDDLLEARIPWSLINVRDPIHRTVQQDFYAEGLDDETSISSIGLGLGLRDSDGYEQRTPAFSYRLPILRNQKYHGRLRLSANALKEYWQQV